MSKKKQYSLSGKKLQQLTFKALEKYKKLSFLELFAMYVGVVQIFEIGLKNLLAQKFGYDLEQIDKWTLGRTVKELKNNFLREDFINLANTVVSERNYVAHELLSNQMFYYSILNGKAKKTVFSKEQRFLQKAVINLEQTIIIFGWLDKNNYWDMSTTGNI